MWEIVGILPVGDMQQSAFCIFDGRNVRENDNEDQRKYNAQRAISEHVRNSWISCA